MKGSERYDLPSARWVTAWFQSTHALLGGDIKTAEHLAEESLALGTETGAPDALTFYGALLSAVRWHQGRKAELEPLIAQIVAEAPAVPGFTAELAHCRIEAGNHSGARELLDTAAVDHFASIPYDVVWTTALADWVEVVVSLDADHLAPTLLDLLAPYRDQVVFNGVTLLGPVADYLAMIETMLGHYDEAHTHLNQAMAIHRRLQAPFFSARTLLHHAELCNRRKESRDGERARSLLEEVLTISHVRGYAGLRRRAEALNP
jgi:hypothetical protein